MGTKLGVGRNWQRLIALLAVVLLTFGTLSCAKPTAPQALMSEPTVEPNRLASRLSEVSPPESVQTLKQVIDAYTPQVRILSPRPGEIIEDTSIAVRFQVRGLPIFKDEDLELGPHLHVFLDNEPYQAVYDLAEPLVFKDLSPGTHTLRVFASRPWHESFKNQGAFDQRTFHVFAQTPQDELDADKPLLTYSRPQGGYGAEPIMLDFYLTNAPLHMAAQEDPDDDIQDWRIRCTVNGESFVFNQWQPIYLKGFTPGKNWVQLELIDEAGRPIENRFNNTVRVLDYQPGGNDTLSKLTRGELDVRDIAGIIDPTYEPPAKPEPKAEVEAPAPAVTEPEAEQPAMEAPKVPEAAQEPEVIEEPEVTLPDLIEEPEITEPEVKEPGLIEEPEVKEPEVTKELEEPETTETLPQPSVVPEPADVAPETPAATDEAITETPEASQTPEIEQENLPETDQEPLSTEETPADESQASTPALQAQPPVSSDKASELESAPTVAPIPSPVIEPSEQSGAKSSSETEDLEPAPAEIEPDEFFEAKPSPEAGLDAEEPGITPAPEAKPGTESPMAAPSQPSSTAASETPDETIEKPAGNKLSERYKRWRQSLDKQLRRVSPNSESQEMPDDINELIAPSTPSAPDANEPDNLSDEPAAVPDQDEPTETPDLDTIKPYMIEPYLTEPRLDIDPFDGGDMPEEDSEPPKEVPTPSSEQPFI